MAAGQGCKLPPTVGSPNWGWWEAWEMSVWIVRRNKLIMRAAWIWEEKHYLLTASEMGSFPSSRWQPSFVSATIESTIARIGLMVRFDLAEAGHSHACSSSLSSSRTMGSTIWSGFWTTDVGELANKEVELFWGLLVIVKVLLCACRFMEKGISRIITCFVSSVLQ